MASLYLLPVFRYTGLESEILLVGKTDFTAADVNGYETRT